MGNPRHQGVLPSHPRRCGRPKTPPSRVLCVLSVWRYTHDMTGAIAHDEAERLRAALEQALPGSEGASSALDTFLRLVDVLEANPDAVVFAADSLVSTQEAADLLGVSRMTVVRLVDRGELASESGGVHRRIAASEVARYQAASARRRAGALRELAQEIADGAPDEVIRTR